MIDLKCLILFFFILVQNTFGQVNNLNEKYLLDNRLNESSGIIFYNNRIISHNDSGNPPYLYEMDSISNTILRTIHIINANNNDWEAIAQDNNYIYVGDFGNNRGNRTDLKIYRVSKNNYNNSISVQADIINFSYENQTDFSVNNQTNFDAEAMIIKQNSIWIFTKNHGDLRTNVYEIPKTPGNYIAHLIYTFDVNCLITAASYNQASNVLLLIGYDYNLYPYIISISDFINGTPSINRMQILQQGVQIEGLTQIGGNHYFITNELFDYQSFHYPAKLFSFDYDFSNSSIVLYNENNTAILYPNPSRGNIMINFEDNFSGNVIVYSQIGKLLARYKIVEQKNFNLKILKKGIYFIKISNTNEQIKYIKCIIQ